MFDDILGIIQSKFSNKNFIPLHEPVFIGNEKKYLLDCIDSTFVSSVGQYVDKFESMVCSLTGSKYAIAVVNGTNALQISLLLAGVKKEDEVITQSFSFVATANAISYCNATPIFIDIDKNTMGMSARSLEEFLEKNARMSENGECINVNTERRIAACVPMHTFGHACELDKIVQICEDWNITLVEDAAESIGSYYKNIHTGRFGKYGVFSLNGNKTITSGGGGVIVTDDEQMAKKAKHLTTQAKTPHKWEFNHDLIGYNFRMPNLNAAVACAQLEKLDDFLKNKRELASYYKESFKTLNIQFFEEPVNSRSNYWLNALVFSDKKERDEFLVYSNSKGIMTRPAWNLLSTLPMYENCETDGLIQSKWLIERLVNIPSSVRID